MPRRGALLSLAGGALTLAGCAGPFSGPGTPPPPPPAPVAPVPTTTVIGQGSVKGALILPMSATGNAGRTAQTMKQAAEMALAEFQGPDVSLLVLDDQGTPTGAQAAAQQALQERCEIILGPIFAPAVQAVSQVVRPQGIPIIAFSTDEAVAARGAYLLSFLPSTDVERIIGYASSQNRKVVAALLPDDAYGTVVDGELRTVASRNGVRIIAIERYALDRAKMAEAVRKITPSLAQADSLFLPDGADAVGLVVDSLRTAQAPLANLKLLGTGRWDDPRLFRNPNLTGSWFSAPDAAGFQQFAQRFRARFNNTDPARTASLAYDATLLVAALTRQVQGPNRFAEATLTNANGFAGIDGIFRFTANGLNQRGIAVLEIRNGSVVAVSPAPRSFTPAAG